MASSIYSPFYINMVTLSREDALLLLSLLLISATSWSEEDLKDMGDSVGIDGDIRAMLTELGRKIDVNWDVFEQEALKLLENED